MSSNKYGGWGGVFPFAGFPSRPHKKTSVLGKKPCVQVKRLLGSVKKQKESDRVTLFACVLIELEGLGDESPWKMSVFGSRLLHENFSQFHPFLPPERNIFLFCLACPPPSRWPSFKHSNTKMGSLDVDLCTQQYHSYTFHVQIPPQHVSVQRRRCRHA